MVTSWWIEAAPQIELVFLKINSYIYVPVQINFSLRVHLRNKYYFLQDELLLSLISDSNLKIIDAL